MPGVPASGASSSAARIQNANSAGPTVVLTQVHAADDARLARDHAEHLRRRRLGIAIQQLRRLLLRPLAGNVQAHRRVGDHTLVLRHAHVAGGVGAALVQHRDVDVHRIGRDAVASELHVDRLHLLRRHGLRGGHEDLREHLAAEDPLGQDLDAVGRVAPLAFGSHDEARKDVVEYVGHVRES